MYLRGRHGRMHPITVFVAWPPRLQKQIMRDWYAELDCISFSRNAAWIRFVRIVNLLCCGGGGFGRLSWRAGRI